jgi:sec-independent protein translocase protein TatA
MGNFGGGEVLIVLVVILLLFGSTQLPKLARSLGQAQKELKAGMKEGETGSSSDAKTDGDADKTA